MKNLNLFTIARNKLNKKGATKNYKINQLQHDIDLTLSDRVEYFNEEK